MWKIICFMFLMMWFIVTSLGIFHEVVHLAQLQEINTSIEEICFLGKLEPEKLILNTSVGWVKYDLEGHTEPDETEAENLTTVYLCIVSLLMVYGLNRLFEDRKRDKWLRGQSPPPGSESNG